jgi:hypothetical protein
MARKASIYAFVILALLAVSAGLAYRSIQHRSNSFCGYCQRPIRPKLAAVAEIGGETRRVCCARCAVSESVQEKKRVRLISVTDYASGTTLDPAKAWFVDGSRAIACSHDMTRLDESKHMQQLAFDRCSPGTFAFARKADADAFIEQNGGVLLTLAQLMQGAWQ